MLWTSVEMASWWRGQALVSILQNFRVERDFPCWKCWSVTCYLLQLVTFWFGLLGKGILTMFSASFFLLTKLFTQHTNVAGFLFQFSSDARTSFPQLSLCPCHLSTHHGALGETLKRTLGQPLHLQQQVRQMAGLIFKAIRMG